MPDFKNKLAIVFGGGRDIGSAIAIELARNGAEVALSYNASDPQKTIDTCSSLMGKKPICKQVDALDTAAVRAFITEVAQESGKNIDVLINVVGGIVARKKMEEMDDAFWDHVFALNVKSVFAATQAALQHFNEEGAIVNLSSQAGRDGGGTGSIAYGATKGAIMTFTRGLAKELGPRRIRVNAVCPGMINTDFHNIFTTPEVRQKVAAATPLGREGEAGEVAKLVTFLASSDASYINGACVDINGGILFS